MQSIMDAFDTLTTGLYQKPFIRITQRYRRGDIDMRATLKVALEEFALLTLLYSPDRLTFVAFMAMLSRYESLSVRIGFLTTRISWEE